jgi:DNA-directed RNA polymerase specialized sigma24 family protein
MNHDSPDQLIGRLNAGDVDAIERVFVAYEPYLRMAVRRRLSPRLRSKVDSADIVQSVFADLLCGVRARDWNFAGRAQLEALLRKIAWRRLADRYQKHARAAARERSLDDAPSHALFDLAQARPSQVAQGREFWERRVLYELARRLSIARRPAMNDEIA